MQNQNFSHLEKNELISIAKAVCESIEYDFCLVSKQNRKDKPGKEVFALFFNLTKKAIREEKDFFETIQLILRTPIPKQTDLTIPYWNALKKILDIEIKNFQNSENMEHKFLYMIACVYRMLYI